jgi:hypothetical protein
MLGRSGSLSHKRLILAVLLLGVLVAAALLAWVSSAENYHAAARQRRG